MNMKVFVRSGLLQILALTVRFTSLIGIVLLSSVATLSQTSSAPPSAPVTHWPTVDGTVVLKDFRFGTGETLPELRLHHLTLGTPHRNAAGHADNAVLLLLGIRLWIMLRDEIDYQEFCRRGQKQQSGAARAGMPETPNGVNNHRPVD